MYDTTLVVTIIGRVVVNNKEQFSSSNIAIKAKNLWKVYNNEQVSTVALKNISLEIEQGSFVAIIGPSGSGKSTLIHLLAGLDRATQKEEQELEVNAKSILNRSENWLSEFRANNIGFVLQFFGLLETLTSLENVMMGAYFGNEKKKHLRQLAEEVLKSVGLSDKINHYPSQLSGGEKQRVAISRALVNKPSIVFADEPTGNLDSQSGTEILSLLKKLNEEYGITIMLVSHDPKARDYVDRVLEIVDGEIVSDT
ncbi:MAG: ABC transporter ATP-binding protein, partial [Asgard group archaeon]|nr:ABC transporter ATP-binding protein [Asgard group archaeon]